jgi:hypothetical protein
MSRKTQTRTRRQQKCDAVAGPSGGVRVLTATERTDALYLMLGQLAKRVDMAGPKIEALAGCVDALEDQYNGLGGSHDALMKRVDELDKWADKIVGEMNAHGEGVLARLKALEKRVETLEEHELCQKFIEKIILDEVFQDRPPRWYTRLWTRIRDWYNRVATCGPDGGSYWSDYNATHPMPRGRVPNWGGE